MHKAGSDAQVAVPAMPLLRRRMGGTTSPLGKSFTLIRVLCPFVDLHVSLPSCTLAAVNDLHQYESTVGNLSDTGA